jgi:hypothetical protein
VLTGGTTGVDVPVAGVVLQEASRIALMIARTIQRWWWTCLGDWNRRYIQLLSLRR